ncbi:UPF0711 protein C18orf21 homolog [Aplochiton taeniatus]
MLSQILWTFKQPIGKTVICPFCYQWFQPGNHRVRLRPKRQPSARVQSVLRREARGKRCSLAQVELLRRYRNSSSTLNTMAPKSASKDKTPCNTPRSISFNTPGSGSSSSSKMPSVKKSPFQRLRKLLTLEDSQGKKKKGLKDFLSSL